MEEGVQLTWMDAMVENWVVTPRAGKPVEVNALWYNASDSWKTRFVSGTTSVPPHTPQWLARSSNRFAHDS